MINKRIVNKTETTKCSQLNNVVTDGYLTPEMEYKELTKGGEQAINAIEMLKRQNTEAQQKVMSEMETTEALTNKIRQASQQMTEKVENVYKYKTLMNDYKKALNDYNQAIKDYDKVKSIHSIYENELSRRSAETQKNQTVD